jgi:hypothetical protein
MDGRKRLFGAIIKIHFYLQSIIACALYALWVNNLRAYILLRRLDVLRYCSQYCFGEPKLELVLAPILDSRSPPDKIK